MGLTPPVGRYRPAAPEAGPLGCGCRSAGVISAQSARFAAIQGPASCGGAPPLYTVELPPLAESVPACALRARRMRCCRGHGVEGKIMR